MTVTDRNTQLGLMGHAWTGLQERGRFSQSDHSEASGSQHPEGEEGIGTPGRERA